MDGMTLDNLTTVFGNLQRSQEAQTKTLDTIKGVIEAKTDKINEYLVKMVQSIADMQRSMVSTVTSLGSDINERQLEQISATEKHTHATAKYNDTISKGFKALTSSFLTKEGTQAVQPQQKELRPKSETERQPTKLEKQSYKEQVAIDTKMGLLLKEVQSQKNTKESGGILKFLAPILALVGGFAVLSFAAMKFGPTRQFLQNIQKNGLFNTLKGLMSKFQDKKVTDWLRGLPLIGRFFDIYDSFTAFAKGDWRGGLKHLAFAIPFGETIINIIGGKTYGTKEAFLGKGGATNLIKNFSLKNIWTNFKQVISDFFAPITKTFNEIVDIVKTLGGGDAKSIKEGWAKLADYFPMLYPIANFLTNATTDLFNMDFVKEAQVGKGADMVNFGDIVKISLKNVWNGISKFFHKVLNIFMTTGEILGSIGDLFSGDYGKQASALNKLDELAPGVGGSLRVVMAMLNALEDTQIKDGDSFATIASKLATKGVGTKKYSRGATLKQEASDVQEKLSKTPEDSEERVKLTARQTNIDANINIEKQVDIAKARQETINKQQEALNKLMSPGILNGFDIGEEQTKQRLREISELEDSIAIAKKSLANINANIKEQRTKLVPEKDYTNDALDGQQPSNKQEEQPQTEHVQNELDNNLEKLRQTRSSAMSSFMDKAGITSPFADVFKDMQPKPLIGEGVQSPVQQAIEKASANKDQINITESIITGMEKSSIFSNLGALKEILIAMNRNNKFLEQISDSSAITASKDPKNINVMGAGGRAPTELRSKRDGGVRATHPNVKSQEQTNIRGR
jgi:hypothetical protein